MLTPLTCRPPPYCWVKNDQLLMSSLFGLPSLNFWSTALTNLSLTSGIRRDFVLGFWFQRRFVKSSPSPPWGRSGHRSFQKTVVSVYINTLINSVVKHIFLDKRLCKNIVNNFTSLSIVTVPCISMDHSMFEKRIWNAELVISTEGF